MRFATWNVNSIRTRVERVLAFLQRSEVDVLAMQEIKCKSEQFPVAAFNAAGYEVAVHGLNQWNGVAIASRVGLTNVATEFPGQPAYDGVIEARALGATCAGRRLWSLYIPNGRELDHPHYAYKLEWLASLRTATGMWLTDQPDTPLLLAGDWNVAPTDTDVWDIAAFAGKTHVSAPEREAFAAFTAAGMQELTRQRVTQYTYWDYQQLRFPRNEGMRIDFIYGSPAAAAQVSAAHIDRDERKGKGASDHVPVLLDLHTDPFPASIESS